MIKVYRLVIFKRLTKIYKIASFKNVEVLHLKDSDDKQGNQQNSNFVILMLQIFQRKL